MYELIIWDWNGTILNDISASLASVNDMLEARKMEPISIDYYRDCIGVPIIKFYEKVFDLPNENYEDLLKQYNEGYLLHLKDCSVSDGVAETLKKYHNIGVKQIIVSSSQNSQLKTNVEKYGLTEYFDAILGSDDYFAESKIQRAKNYININNIKTSLVVGDLEHDYELARELGSDCILLTTGHESMSRLMQTGALLTDNISKCI